MVSYISLPVATALFVEYSLSSSDSPRGLRVTLNPLCAEPLNELFVQGLFGVRQALNGECVYLQSSTQHFTDSHELFIELDLTLEPTTYEYCAEAILNGREKTIVDGRELVSLHVTSISFAYS